ncbi:MAG: peptidase M56, partial [Lentisphaerae bacterium]|nr:peptidase M56 [Lentisphaerota bacterium]
MTDVFLKLINMSISASWLVLVVVILRLLLKKAPKWLNPVLWGIVCLRLILPFSIESILSLIPSAETISPEVIYSREPAIHSGIQVLNSVGNPIITESFATNPMASVSPLQIWIPIAAIVWIVGAAAMLIYTVISYLHLNKRVKTAVLLRDNIYQSENVASPFVLGILRPRIYLPFSMNEKDIDHVIAHEQTHIKRRDHRIKPLGFLLLALYWFNPVLWVAYILLCRDIELACDEGVIKELCADERADYSDVLLSCSVSRRVITACPLAFGEVSVKERVKNVLNYKKPAFWLTAVAVVVCIIVAVC